MTRPIYPLRKQIIEANTTLSVYGTDATGYYWSLFLQHSRDAQDFTDDITYTSIDAALAGYENWTAQ